MSLMPKKPREIWKLIVSLANTALDEKEDTTTQEITPTKENRYFTFDKNGKLIDVDDDAVLALERRTEENWRRDYMESVENSEDYGA